MFFHLILVCKFLSFFKVFLSGEKLFNSQITCYFISELDFECLFVIEC